MIFLRINMLFNVFLFRIFRIFRILRIKIDIIILLFNIIVCKFNHNVLFNVLFIFYLCFA